MNINLVYLKFCSRTFLRTFVAACAVIISMSTTAMAQSGMGSSITGAYLPDQPDGNDATYTARFEAEYNQFTTLMGARPKYFVGYTDNSQGAANMPGNASWGAWSWAKTGASYVGPTSGTIPVIGFPICDPSAQYAAVDTFYQEVISGSLDADYKGIVDGWQGQGYTNVIFRPGYEFTGQTQAWSPDWSTNPNVHADFVAAFQRIVNDVRAEAAAKGVTCKISWCTAGRQGSSYDISVLYPGDAYVDIISTDIYAGGTPDNLINWGTGGTTSAANLAAWYATPGDADHYYQWVDSGYLGIARPPLGPYGWSVQNTIDFAKLHNKPMAFDETGCGGSGDNYGNDDPDFPAWAAATIAGAKAQGVTVDHVDIWDNGGFAFTSGGKPNESAAWAKGFGSTSAGSLPSGWTNTNITGTFTLAGSAFAIGGVYTLRGAGTSITSTADSFDLAAESVTGNQTIIARITGVISTSGGSKTSVMFRDSTAVGAIYIEENITPTGGVQFYTRSATNGTPALNGAATSGVTPSSTTPIWLKLVKSGTSYAAFYSTSVTTPSTWTQVGTAVSVTLTQSPYLAGLGVCSYDNGTGTRAGATADNVSVTPTSGGALPAGQTDADIGGPNPTGTASYNSGVYTTTAGGANIYGTSDQYNYIYQSGSGDQTLIARMTGLSGTNLSPYAKAGVEFRDSTAANAIYVNADFQAGGTVEFTYRSATGATATLFAYVTVSVTPSPPTPVWVKLVKSGTSYTAFYSTSLSTPSTWTQVGSTATVSMTNNNSYLVGLCTCSHNNGTAVTATYDNVNFATSSSGPVAYWKLDETSGGLSSDSSGNGITGTWENSPTFSATVPSNIPLTDPGCLSFNGTNQYVTMGNPTVLPSGRAARTICGWGKSNSTASGYRWIASYGTNSTGEAMFIGMNGTTLDAGAYISDLTVPNFWDSNWHFIVLTYDGTTANLYADGVLKASSAETWNLVPANCYIGRQVNGAEYWNGLVDDVRIYNYALSASQVSALY